MSIRTWLNQEERRGQHFFSLEVVQQQFPEKTRPVLLSELSRLSHQHILTNVHNGFYVKTPVMFQARGIIPVYYYIDQLMAYLGKPYYLSLLTAGEMFGAAHQRPQRTFVTTTLPVASTSERKNPYIHWNYREKIPKQLLIKRNGETGQLSISSQELTAVDLVQYPQHIGGLDNAATVLAELLECTNFAKADPSLYHFGSLPAFQRLGYIMEEILDEKKQADILYQQLKCAGKQFRWSKLSPNYPPVYAITRNQRWRIEVNNELEIDDL